MNRLAESVRGRNPLEKLTGQEGLYRGMADDKRREIGPEAMRGISAVRKTVGPEIDSLIKELTEGMLKRLPKEAQGFGKLVGKNGIDFDQVERLRGVSKRIGFDKVASMQTAGFSEEAAQGFVRLLERASAARDAQRRAMTKGGDLESDTARSRGVMENAAAVKNQVGGVISGALAPVVSKANDIVGGASKSTLGSAGLMAGGFAAAGLGAYGLSKISGKLGGAGAMADAGAKMGIMEQVTGNKTIPVYVVNIAEMANGIGKSVGTSIPKIGGGGSTLMEKAGAATVGLEIGMVVGTVVEGILDRKTQGTNKEGYSGNIVERGMYSAFQSLAPLLEPLRGHSQGIDDILRALERGNQERKQRKLEQPADTDARGATQGATK